MSTTPKSDAAYALNEPVQLYEQCRELELKCADFETLIQGIVAFDNVYGLPISDDFRTRLRVALPELPPTGDKTVPSSIPCTGENQANPAGQSGPTGGEGYPQRYVDGLNSEVAKLRGELMELRQAHGAAVMAQAKAIERAEEAECAVRVANSGTFMQRLTAIQNRNQELRATLLRVKEMGELNWGSFACYLREATPLIDRALDWKPEP